MTIRSPAVLDAWPPGGPGVSIWSPLRTPITIGPPLDTLAAALERAATPPDRARRQYHPSRRPREPRLVTRQPSRPTGNPRSAEAGRLSPSTTVAEQTPAVLCPHRAYAIRSLAATSRWSGPDDQPADRQQLLRILDQRRHRGRRGADKRDRERDITWAAGRARTSGRAVRPVGRAGPSSYYYPALLGPFTGSAGGRTQTAVQIAARSNESRPGYLARPKLPGLHRPAGPANISEHAIRENAHGRPDVLTDGPG